MMYHFGDHTAPVLFESVAYYGVINAVTPVEVESWLHVAPLVIVTATAVVRAYIAIRKEIREYRNNKQPKP